MNWEKLLEQLGSGAMTIVFKLIAAGLILLIGGRLIKWILGRIVKSKGFQKMDISVQSFTKSFLKIAAWVILIISAAGIIGIPMSSFLTLLASAGVAIGLALQGALSNLAGGLMILFFRPFRVGDFIETGAHSGTVQDITVFYTILLTPDNKRITLPNGTLTNAAVVNYSEKETRRVDLEFSVGYDCDIDKVKGLLLRVAEEHELVLDDPAPFARLIRQDDSALAFCLRAWCKSDDYWTVYFDLNEQVKKELDANGMEIPFPQLDVHMDTKSAQ